MGTTEKCQELEALASNKQSIAELRERKRQLEDEVSQLERQIHRLEGQYLEKTGSSNLGNVIKGFEPLLSRVRNTPQPQKKQRIQIKDTDRLFSNSSATWVEAVTKAPQSGA
eukprot:TRINITY_DN7991_c0_g1_i1.p1 TRINITY_DN7991_c0_g1~~TRINITY_DN7991_c0_g1_i1.p1  ORF type:complete len:112 (+),score=24.98 TRINITY_DN7991_c0_g1_i1:45-380(+)